MVFDRWEDAITTRIWTFQLDCDQGGFALLIEVQFQVVWLLTAAVFRHLGNVKINIKLKFSSLCCCRRVKNRSETACYWSLMCMKLKTKPLWRTHLGSCWLQAFTSLLLCLFYHLLTCNVWHYTCVSDQPDEELNCFYSKFESATASWFVICQCWLYVW